MGKTSLCTDAAEPVAGGAAADKYVSRQHHGVAQRAKPRHAALSCAVAHRPIPRHGHAESHGIPRCVYHTAPPNSSSPLRGFDPLSPVSPLFLLSLLAHSLFLSLSLSHSYSFALHLFLPFPFLTLSRSIVSRLFFPFSASPPVLPVSMDLFSSAGTARSIFFILQRAIGSVPRLYTFEYYGNVHAKSYCRASAIRSVVPRGAAGRKKEPRRRTVRAKPTGRERRGHNPFSVPSVLSDEYIL